MEEDGGWRQYLKTTPAHQCARALPSVCVFVSDQCVCEGRHNGTVVDSTRRCLPAQPAGGCSAPQER